MSGPLRYSINVIPECPIAEIVALAVEAERLGFERCWVYDEGLVTRDVHVTLAAVVAATSRLEVGPGITNPYTRHPAQTASAVASLDELSGGRAFLGIGAGGSLTLDPIGIERVRPLVAVEEAIAVARALFSGRQATFDGASTALASATMSYGRPDIEIWLAGRGPRMLSLGAARADGVMLDFIHKPDLARSIERIRSVNPSARICYSTAVVTDDDDLEFVRPHLTYRLVDAPDPVKDALGLGATDVERIRSAMADGLAAAAVHVRDEWIEPFIIRGPGDACRREIAALAAEHDVEEFLVPLFDMADQRAYLRRLAEALIGPG